MAEAIAAKRSALVSRTLAVVRLATEFTKAYQREDLGLRLERARVRLEDPAFHVLVVGEFKQGKSSLVNALLGTDICPVDDDIATAVPTAIRWSEPATAALLLRPPDAGRADPEPQDAARQEISVDDVARHAVEGHPDTTGQQRIQSVDVGLPIELLRDGLVVVDTPGVGGLGSAHSTITMGALPYAEAVLFASDASLEFTAPEIEFMEAARGLCPNLVCVQTKTDFYPSWRKIVDINRGHLDRLGITTPILPVSSTLHVAARDLDDQELDEESGFPALRRHLSTEIVAEAERLAVSAVADDLGTVIQQMEGHFKSRKAALDDPETADAKVRELEAAKVEADELKSRSARWQQTLADGGLDLTAEIDHDIRSRFRTINQEVDGVLEVSDPADIWAELEPWIYRRVAQDVVLNYQFLLQRAQELAQRVGEHFDDQRSRVPVALDAQDPSAALAQVDVAALDVSKMGLAAQGLSGLRGGYIGSLMFGALGASVPATFLGGAVAVALPFAVPAIGLALGHKALRDEKSRMVTQRRTQAKAVQRKYMDEVTFQTGKDSRDSLRRINRQLRDHFQVIAEEQARSISETLEAVQAAVRADQATRRQNMTYVEAELKRIVDLRTRVEAIEATTRPA